LAGLELSCERGWLLFTLEVAWASLSLSHPVSDPSTKPVGSPFKIYSESSPFLPSTPTLAYPLFSLTWINKINSKPISLLLPLSSPISQGMEHQHQLLEFTGLPYALPQFSDLISYSSLPYPLWTHD
jgi:hypothetical protein